MADEKNKAGGYLRLSIVDGDTTDSESTSITNQRKIIHDFAQANNIEIIDYYIDDGYSGGNFDRPDFKRMISDIEKGIINCVITKDTSRLGRDFIETGNYIYKYFPEHDVRFIAILENFDTERPSEADDIIPFKTVVNDMYLKDTSKKIKSIRHDLMRQGLLMGSTVPYGYKRSPADKRKLIIDDYAAPIVKRIFEMSLNGMTNVMIARTLSNEGILPPNIYNERKCGKQCSTTNLWKDCTIRDMLKNEIYIGTLIQGKYERVSLKSKKRKLLPREKWIIVEGAVKPIIDDNVFEEVNKKKKKKSNSQTRIRIYDYLLKGLVKCADCGNTMCVKRCKQYNGSHVPVYCCKTYQRYRNGVCSMHYFREENLNELVLKEVRNILNNCINTDNLKDSYDEVMSNENIVEKYKNDYDSLHSKIRMLDKTISELYKDKATGVITENDFMVIKNNLEDERNGINESISKLELMLGKVKRNVNNDKTKTDIIEKFMKVKSPTKQIMEKLIDKITIDENKNVKIYFNFKIIGDTYAD